MTHGRLTPLQSQVLDAFFAVERGFFVSGGGALCGFYLKHRETTDLDLFTVDDDAFARGRLVLADVARRASLSFEVKQDAPAFLRAVVGNATDALVVDFVRESTVQTVADKPVIENVRVDDVREIFVNKLTTLVGRQEIRDLVDVMALERTGLRAEDYLGAALAKDGGCTPATLAWLLRDWRLDEKTRVTAGFALDDLRAFRDALVDRMVSAATPTSR